MHAATNSTPRSTRPIVLRTYSKIIRTLAAGMSCFMAVCAGAAIPDPVAVYAFNGDLESSIPGAPALQVVESSGGEFFDNETFASRTTGTWSWEMGTGLMLDTSNLRTGPAWSVGMTFRLDSVLSYNKLLDTQDRALDTGWYNDPGFAFEFFPGAAGNELFFADQEVTAIIVYDGETATGYLDGVPASDSNGVADADISAAETLHFFIDDLGTSNFEVAPGTVAAIFFWDAELDPADIAALLPLPQLIEPCSSADVSLPFGITDLADIGAFVTGFTSGDPIADLDCNGLYDLSDIAIFVTAFTAGCP